MNFPEAYSLYNLVQSHVIDQRMVTRIIVLNITIDSVLQFPYVYGRNWFQLIFIFFNQKQVQGLENKVLSNLKYGWTIEKCYKWNYFFLPVTKIIKTLVRWIAI